VNSTNKQRKKKNRLTVAITTGTYRGDVIRNGQWNKANTYCPECHASNGMAHKRGCKGRRIRISTSARMPKKTASAKRWERFYEKFVNCEPYKEYGRPEWKL